MDDAVPKVAIPRCSHTTQGFTLIEVLVALTVLSLALGIIFAGLSASLRGRRTAVDYQQAALLAESKLNSIGVETNLEEGHTAGRFDDRFRWQALVTAYIEEGRNQANESPKRPVIVTVTVVWGDPSDERSISLSTLRLAGRPIRNVQGF